MSLHDGPGIRSTLFVKGCNMRCRWCHNPETWEPQRQLQFVQTKCMGCGLCADICSVGALLRPTQAGGAIQIDRTLCKACGGCAYVCPSGALSFVGKEITVEEAVQFLIQDRIFYEESGGGVTISGGEPLLQGEFVAEVLSLCRAQGIHTALESNLNVAWSAVERMLPYVDLWMCDLKIADEKLHKTWTGATNHRVKENLQRLSEQGAPVIVRTPVIPTVNDTPEAIAAIAQILQGMENLLYYELLPFHNLGADKFTMLGIEPEMDMTLQLDKAAIPALYEVVEKMGINTKK